MSIDIGTENISIDALQFVTQIQEPESLQLLLCTLIGMTKMRPDCNAEDYFKAIKEIAISKGFIDG